MNKKILKLALPNILSNLSVPLVGLVDTALSGHLGDAAHLGGLALGGTIFSFIFWGFAFLRMGTTGLSAQAWGADNREQLQAVFSRASSVALFAGMLIWFLQGAISYVAIWLFEASSEAEYWAIIYFKTRIWAAPATLMLYVINGWSLGAQNAILPMGVTIIQNVGNVIFSLFFVVSLNLGIKGVALGTVVGNYLASTVGLLWLFKKYNWLFVWPKFEWFNKDELWKFSRMNIDLVVRTLALVFTFAWFTAESATFGDAPLAANTILLQLWMFFSYGIDGFAYAAESLVGALKGKGENLQLKNMITRVFQWGLAMGILGSILFLIGENTLLNLFTNDTSTIIEAKKVYLWMVIAPAIGSFCYIWDGIYVGLTATSEMRNSMLIATIVVFFPLYFTAVHVLGIHALWLAMLGFLVARALGQWWFYRFRISI